MGVTVREKPKGSGVYHIFVHHKGAISSVKAGSKKLAESMAVKARKELLADNLGIVEVTEAPLFGGYAKAWVDRYVQPPMREPGTYRRYTGLLENHISPVFSSLKISEVSRGRVRDFLASKYRAGSSWSSVSTMQTVLSGIFTHAVDDEIIAVNPCVGVLKLINHNKAQTTEIEPFTMKESQAILTTIEKHYPVYHSFFLTLFRTGMRLGECCGLKWEDINWNDGYIKVQRTASHQRVKDGTKTNQARNVDMTMELADRLMKAYKTHKLQTVRTGKKIPWIFHKEDKLHYHTTLRRIFKSAVAKTGINERRIHDIRHTYASLLLSNNAPILYVSKQLGHASVKMTLDIYSHYIPLSGEKHVNFLDGNRKSENKVKSRRA